MLKEIIDEINFIEGAEIQFQPGVLKSIHDLRVEQERFEKWFPENKNLNNVIRNFCNGARRSPNLDSSPDIKTIFIDQHGVNKENLYCLYRLGRVIASIEAIQGHQKLIPCLAQEAAHGFYNQILVTFYLSKVSNVIEIERGRKSGIDCIIEAKGEEVCIHVKSFQNKRLSTQMRLSWEISELFRKANVPITLKDIDGVFPEKINIADIEERLTPLPVEACERILTFENPDPRGKKHQVRFVFVKRQGEIRGTLSGINPLRNLTAALNQITSTQAAGTHLVIVVAPKEMFNAYQYKNLMSLNIHGLMFVSIAGLQQGYLIDRSSIRSETTIPTLEVLEDVLPRQCEIYY